MIKRYTKSCKLVESLKSQLEKAQTEKQLAISQLEQYGLCSANFVTYYLCNYLPNIEDADTQYISDAVDASELFKIMSREYVFRNYIDTVRKAAYTV